MNKKIIDSDTASHFDCCSVDRKCTGDKCMAWVSQPVEADKSDTVDLKPAVSRGYCGMLFA